MSAVLLLAKISWTFLRIGVVFVGGGYVLIPLLHRIMVDELRWLTLKEFLDGVALSQLTPGPLAMLATFTGFRVGGFPGALAATLFIFMPCTLLMFLIGNRYHQIRKITFVNRALDGLVPAVVGLVAAAAWNLGKTSLEGPRDFLLLAGGFLVLRFTSVTPMTVILLAGSIGFLFRFS